MTPDLLTAAQSHAEAARPGEACGLVVVHPGAHVGEYRPVRSISPALDRFAVHPQDWADAEDQGRIAAVVHAHTEGPATPSPVDHQDCNVNGVPWVLLGGDGSWAVLQPAGLPLEGREFCWGITDCFSLVCDWFRQARGIDLPDFLRAPEFWRDRDLFSEGMAVAGFGPVAKDDLAAGDVLLFSIHGLGVVNHCGIYLGAGRMLHHLPGSQSIIESVGAWVRCLKGVVRHG